jgi:hypothetical protein
MTWIATPESSTITRFMYTTSSRVLTVEFKNGGRYNYYDVPEALFERMKRAPSKGQFHAQAIKGVYRYARV